MPIDLAKVEDVEFILSQDKAIKLLRKEQAGLIIAFLWKTFKREHQQAYRAQELTTALSDFLFVLNEEGTRYPRPPRDYLENWTQEGFLRQYYETQQEEATFELTPAAERALLWVTSLDKREFVGAESRLRQVFELLRELALGTTEDKDLRLAQLQQRRAEIDQEIEDLEQGRFRRLDATNIRERFFLLEDMATRLRADFREIEANFRQLNAQAREEQIGRQSARGEILDDIFSAQDAIMETDQGKTFRAFWAFLMDQQRQDELQNHLQQVFDLPELEGLRGQSLLPRLKMSLVEAGDRVNQTTGRLVEQLRRFLQSRSFLEHQRTAQIIGEIEQLAVQVKRDPPKRTFHYLEGKAVLANVMERPLFQPPQVLRLDQMKLTVGDARDMVVQGLYDQQLVDMQQLRQHIDGLLRRHTQVTLQKITEHHPVEHGLSELLSYFSIATKREAQSKAVIHPDRTQSITYRKGAEVCRVDMPETTFLS